MDWEVSTHGHMQINPLCTLYNTVNTDVLSACCLEVEYDAVAAGVKLEGREGRQISYGTGLLW